MSRPTTVSEALRRALGRVAPGTPLRDGIDRVVRSKAGALLVLADDPEVLAICTGGFLVDAPYSPQRLSELAKMDGAIIISSDGSRIARANVHLVPDPSVPTSETGTRHRTAERVARSIGVPVISASEEMGVINVYAGGQKHQLQDTGRLLDRSNQALQTLERYTERVNASLGNLTASEVEDVVTLRDVAVVMQRHEMVNRIADEIETMIVELGVDARLLRLQLDELYAEVDDRLDLVIADYLPAARDADDTLAELATLSDDDLRDLRRVAATLHHGGDANDLDLELAPKGTRLLRRVNRLPDELAVRVATHFGDLARLQRASVDELATIDGIDTTVATQIRDTLAKVTESTILDQYN